MGIDEQLTQQSGNPPRIVATPQQYKMKDRSHMVPPEEFKADELITQIIQHEGYRLNPYTDSEGYITGGVGHKFRQSDFDNWNANWSREEKEKYWYDRFQEDIAAAKKHAARVANTNGIQSKFLPVLTEMAFNMGAGFDREFPTFVKDLSGNNPDIEGAIKEMKLVGKDKPDQPSKWYKQVPDRVNSLANILRSIK